MDLLSALVEARSLPSELLQQMLANDSVSTVKEQQVSYALGMIKIHDKLLNVMSKFHVYDMASIVLQRFRHRLWIGCWTH